MPGAPVRTPVRARTESGGPFLSATSWSSSGTNRSTHLEFGTYLRTATGLRLSSSATPCGCALPSPAPNDVFLMCVRPADLVVGTTVGTARPFSACPPAPPPPPRVRGVLPPLIIAFDGTNHVEVVTRPPNTAPQHAPRAREPSIPQRRAARTPRPAPSDDGGPSSQLDGGGPSSQPPLAVAPTLCPLRRAR